MTHTSLPGNEPRRCRGRDDCDPGSPPKHLEPLRLCENAHMNSFDMLYLHDRLHRVHLKLVYAEHGSAGEPRELVRQIDYNVARALTVALGRYLHLSRPVVDGAALFQHDTLRVDADSTTIGIAVQMTIHPHARSAVFMANNQTRQIFNWLSLWLEREVTSHQHTGG